MSTLNYLENAKKTMVKMGFISKDEAEDIEHSVDDAVNLFSDLTCFLDKNPDILYTIKRKIRNDKFNNKYIKEKTIKYTQDALSENKIVATSDLDQNGELNTPNSFEMEMMEMWTLDLGLSDERIREIKSVVFNAISSVLPDDLKEHY